jgi:hypothetical protein
MYRPQYFQILVVDIEGFGKRQNPVQQHLRMRLYQIVREAMADIGIDMGELPVSDRGDGAFWLLPTSVSKVDLTGRFITALQAGLQAHARVSSERAVLRLRAALHAGEVGQDEHGWVGEDLNTACRLVDLQELRVILAAATQSSLVLAVSDGWYSAVVRHDYPGIDSATFWPIRFHAKEVRQTAWVNVPGHERPPGIRIGGKHARPAQPVQDSDPEPGLPPKETPETASAVDGAPTPAMYSAFDRATIHANQVYGRDHIEYRGEGSGGRGD